MKTVAIIQARMSSTRLPGKVLADIAGRPMLDYVVGRVSRSCTLDLVLVATSTNQADNVIDQFCAAQNILCFRGSEHDVLDRYYQAAKYVKADVVVRLTADCPLLDPQVIDKVVHTFHINEYDYISNTLKPTYPDGLDTEVFRYEILEQAWQEARLRSEREHVTPYIRNHPELFRLGSVEHTENLSDLRWTVDQSQDIAFVRCVYERLGDRTSFGMAEILALLKEYPELSVINAGIHPNEGYQKSLREDGLIEEVAW